MSDSLGGASVPPSGQTCSVSGCGSLAICRGWCAKHSALDNRIVFGDFSNFVIVDKPGSMSVEFVPVLHPIRLQDKPSA